MDKVELATWVGEGSQGLAGIRGDTCDVELCGPPWRCALALKSLCHNSQQPELEEFDRLYWLFCSLLVSSLPCHSICYFLVLYATSEKWKLHKEPKLPKF